jgi:PIN domain nuclease of toxin-antitoxin system
MRSTAERAKFYLPGGLFKIALRSSTRGLLTSASIAMRASQLPRHHCDPGDRFIISTALEYNLTVLTPDHRFESYSVPLLWD